VSLPAPQSPRLPPGISVAAVLCLILSGMTGMCSASEAARLVNLSESKEDALRGMEGLAEPAVLERMERVAQAQISALEPMREPRSLVLGALAVTCAFAFVAAGRMLRPAGLSREGMRRLLGGAAIIAALLRTIDGAQWLVVVKRTNAAAVDLLSLQFKAMPPPVADLMGTLFPHLLPALVLAHTFFIAGAFVVLGRYFHSERVRAAVTAQDGPTE
jgi:hypothetical protein